MSRHLLYFPCRDAVFDWFEGENGTDLPQVSVELLAEQREFECRPGNGERRITCHGCGDTRARYVVCYRKGKFTDKLYPRRYPGSGQWHLPGCFSHTSELSSVSGDKTQPPRITPGGDFAALRFDLGDPELRVVAMRRRTVAQATSSRGTGSRNVNRMTIGLQRLARDLLQRSGVCHWRPKYKSGRNERVFNGLVKGALNAVVSENSGLSSAVINSLPGVEFVPWSFLDPLRPKTAPDLTKCVGFGFIESLGAENVHGARIMRLSNHPDCPLVVPRMLLDCEQRNPRSPLHTRLAHPVWVIFVAGKFAGTWKAHAMAAFRVTATGLIPVDSKQEEQMLERLIEEGRMFRRLLLPPPESASSKFIPDVQLLDTARRHFLEVAGLMADEVYAADIARKKAKWGDELLVWDTRMPLHLFSLPPPEAIPYQHPNRLPRDPFWLTPAENEVVLE